MAGVLQAMVRFSALEECARRRRAVIGSRRFMVGSVARKLKWGKGKQTQIPSGNDKRKQATAKTNTGVSPLRLQKRRLRSR